MDPAPAARDTEFANRPPFIVRALDREDVLVIGHAAIAADDLGRGGRREGGEEDETEEERTLQWCSMTRSTMLYSFASSALMK